MVNYVRIYPMMGERGMNMKCKFCFAELEEEASVCPVCGKALIETSEEAMPSVEESAEETTVEATEEATEEVTEPVAENTPDAAPAAKGKKKCKPWQIALIVAGGVLLLAVLIGAVLYGFGINILPRENDIFYKKSYTVKDAVAEKKADVVVATLGDQVLTNGVLQAYYWTGVMDFINNNSSYLSYIGLDPYEPLNKQIYDEETGKTFQQLFLENALATWRRYATLLQLAEESNFTLDAEKQAYLDSFQSEITEIAKESGYEDVEEFIDKEMFPGSSLKAYYAFNRVGYTGLCYYDTVYEGLMPTSAEMEAYYKEHEEELKEKGYDKASGSYYNVRHILIGVTGGTKNDQGEVVYSDADWETCRAAAQKVLNEYLAGEKTEAAFGTLAMKNTEDTGSLSSGGLYEKLTKDTDFVEEFKEWYLDETRKPGDTGLVKSVYGYHVMYFSSSVPIWEYEIQTILLSEATTKFFEDAEKKYPMEVDYKKIVLGLVELGS